jgi:hypothetical protein
VALIAVAGASEAVAPLFKLLILNEQLVRWNLIPLQPRVVTYGFARESIAFPHAYNCKELRPLDGLAQASRLGVDSVEREIVTGLKQWETVTPLRFELASDWNRAQILIGARGETTGSAFADVFPRSMQGSVAAIDRSLICLNPRHKWKLGFGGDPKAYDIRYVATHEAGHAIGLDHPGKTGQLMSYSYQETFRTLQPGDVLGARELYRPLPGQHVARHP